MSIIKERIKSNGLDTNIKFSLGEGVRFTGYQQEIDNITEETKTEIINPIVDNEVRRFQYASGEVGSINILFEFTANGSSYYNAFTSNGARFTTTQIATRDLKILNSFFILDYYDTYDNNTQSKIFTIYNTQILDGEKSIGGTPIPNYRIFNDTVNQFYNWYVPKSYINAQTGFTVTGYVKFSFYNARYGDMTLFYNKDNGGLMTPEKMYFKVLLDLNAMTWKFDYSGDNYPPDATARQIPFSSAYSQKVNAGVESFDNEQQTYPTGNTFQVTDGTYTTV